MKEWRRDANGQVDTKRVVAQKRRVKRTFPFHVSFQKRVRPPVSFPTIAFDHPPIHSF